MVLQIFEKIQGHPYSIWAKYPLQGMDGIAILKKNPDSSVMQNEKTSGWKSIIFRRGVRTKNGMAQ